MEDRTITFQNAKLAKEKGFDLELTNYFYKTPNRGKPFHRTGALNNWNSFKRDNLIDLYFSRPTQTMVRKWLRETKNIELKIVYSENTKGYHSSFLDKKNRCSWVWVVENNAPIFVFEEALETAIEFALKSL